MAYCYGQPNYITGMMKNIRIFYLGWFEIMIENMKLGVKVLYFIFLLGKVFFKKSVCEVMVVCVKSKCEYKGSNKAILIK